MRVFAFNGIIMALLAVVIAWAIVSFAGKRGGNIFKNQGVAWALTALMVVAAIGIGNAASPLNDPAPAPELSTPAPSYVDTSFVWDNARVLSHTTVKTLNQRNERLWNNYNVTIGVVTCDYNKDDLGDYAMKCAEEMGLGGYDMIVVLDIKGDNYWLLQGADLAWDFTDNDCADYAYDYMEKDFAKGRYDDALLNLTEMLEAWYGTYYG